MKKYRIITILIFASFVTGSCKKFLVYQPQGALSASQLTTPAAVEGLATAAYAGIANDWFDAPITSLWESGSIRSDEAYKGGGGLNDNGQWNDDEQFFLVNSTNN